MVKCFFIGCLIIVLALRDGLTYNLKTVNVKYGCIRPGSIKGPDKGDCHVFPIVISCVIICDSNDIDIQGRFSYTPGTIERGSIRERFSPVFVMVVRR